MGDPTKAPGLPIPRRTRRHASHTGSTRTIPKAKARTCPETSTAKVTLTQDQVTFLCRADEASIRAVIEAKATIQRAGRSMAIGHVTKCAMEDGHVTLDLTIEHTRSLELMMRGYIKLEDLVFTAEER